MSKRNIAYTKPDDPSFLKKLKSKVGYKEGPDINTKREVPAFDDTDDREDNDDEKPTVVVLKSGDLTREEVDEITLQNKELDKPEENNGKLIFKKPVKTAEEKNTPDHKKKHKKKKLESKMKKVSNASLLSFEEEDE